jgi:putative transcriptional regulator
MTKLGERLIRAASEARAIARGKADPATYRVHVPDEVDVQVIRKSLNLSQAQFAAKFGLPPATVRDWEQNRRKPEGAARVLLQVIKKEPEAVSRALEPGVAPGQRAAQGRTNMALRRRTSSGKRFQG